MLRPMPLPDELDRGYLGRVGISNGALGEKQCVALMASWAGLDGRSGKEVPRVELLRQVAGMSMEAFVRRHTTLPFRRGITSYCADLEHGDEASRTLLWTSGLRLARPGAYFCAECVEADLDFHGISYWRREHQIPGVLWCNKHEIPLCYVNEEDSFYAPPDVLLGKSHSIPVEWIEQVVAIPATQRYLDICSGLLEQSKPFEVRDVSRTLAERARCRGLQIQARSRNKGTDAHLLSDLVVDTFHGPWLASIFPDLVTKPRGTHLSRMDGVLYMTNSASTVVAYALAASVLFDSADEALRAFLFPGAGASQRRKGRAPLKIGDEALRSSYFAAEGCHAAAARLLNTTMSAIGARLDAMGLPNLSTRGGCDPAKALHAFFVEGRSLAESAAHGKLSQAALNSCIRKIAGPLMGLLVQNCSEAAPTRRKGVRTRQIPPHEAVQLSAYEAAGAT